MAFLEGLSSKGTIFHQRSESLKEQRCSYTVQPKGESRSGLAPAAILEVAEVSVLKLKWCILFIR